MTVDLPPVICPQCDRGDCFAARHDYEPQCACPDPRHAQPAPPTGDDAFLAVAARSPHIAERRHDRAYDDQSPATLFCPNGSKVASFDRQFCNAAAREVIALYEAEASA